MSCPPEQAQLYRGILANRNNDPKESIKLLEPLVDKIASSGDAVHEKLARKALAEDYLRDGDFSKAAKEYQSLHARLESTLTPDEKDEIEMPLKLLPLAAANPPMTVDPCDAFVLQVSRNPLGLTDIPVFVDARPHTWMLDPTAPFNLIARSLAREVGLKVSEEAATIHTLTGRAHAGALDRHSAIHRGRAAHVSRHDGVRVRRRRLHTSRNRSTRCRACWGTRHCRRCSSLTITDNATIELHPARQVQTQEKPAPNYDGARFFLDGDQIIVALGLAPNEQMFAVDAAGQQTYFTSRYYDEHAHQFAGQKAGAIHRPECAARFRRSLRTRQRRFRCNSASAKVDVHFIEVLTQPVGSAALDDVYGVLGVDALDQLRSYTFDYENMRFRVSD